MDAKNADCATRRALIRAFNEGEVTHKLDGKTTRHSIRATAATAFIGTTAAAAAVFCPYGAFEHLRLPASCCQPAMAARAPGYAGRTSWPLPAAVSAPWARATPWRRVTKRTVMTGSNVSSIRRIGHRHGCMPLAKWETGSGRFGGCLIKTRSPNSADRGQAFKRLAHYLMICIKSDLVPRVWRACHYSAISLIRPFLRPVDSS